MKIGDKVCCKMSMFDDNIKNKEYTILIIEGNYLKITTECDYFPNSYRFWGLNETSDFYKFKDYFYTEKEYRKLKLEKLNESR